MVLPPSVQPTPLLSWLGNGDVSQEIRGLDITHRERAGFEYLTQIALRIIDVELAWHTTLWIVQSSRNEASIPVTGPVIESGIRLEARWDWSA